MVSADMIHGFIPPNNVASARFGASVAMRSQYIAISAPGIRTVYTYNWNPATGWQLSGTIVNNDPLVADLFGRSVSLTRDGLRLAVGSPKNNTVYVYSRPTPTGVWGLEATLTANDIPPPAIAVFGSSVAIVSRTSSPDTVLVVGAPGIVSANAAYIFVRNGSNWSQYQKLQGNPPISMAEGFGFSVDVSISGDNILVGQPYKDLSQGHVYIFRRGFQVWELAKVVVASDGANFSRFGASVAFDILNGNRFVVGAPDAMVGSTQNAGKSYIFDYNNNLNDWLQVAILTASGVELVAGSNSGTSVAITSTCAAMGAPNLGTGSVPKVGGVFLSQKVGSNPWTQPNGLLPPVIQPNTEFGTVLSGYPASIEARPLLLVGVPANDILINDGGGAVLYAINA